MESVPTGLPARPLLFSFLPGVGLMFGVSSLSFVGVLYMMGLMVYSAVKEHTSHTARRSLLFIYMCTLLIWTLFPIAWVFHVLNPTSPYGEYLNVFANFMAKVRQASGRTGGQVLMHTSCSFCGATQGCPYVSLREHHEKGWGSCGLDARYECEIAGIIFKRFAFYLPAKPGLILTTRTYSVHTNTPNTRTSGVHSLQW